MSIGRAPRTTIATRYATLYMIQLASELIMEVGSQIPSRRQAISKRSASTLSPALRSLIIWSMLNPASSPAMASFSMALCKDGLSMLASKMLDVALGSHRAREKSVTPITRERTKSPELRSEVTPPEAPAKFGPVRSTLIRKSQLLAAL